ncbi:Pol polyprotein [Smittium culicis]|uniref:Pol polyprotein n=1 Tax=Smittium culicis TaxID=133412 RepID=A0A1R1XIA0_9FUNG|nr:Pol polyprotein [Smittium culicis]
MDFLGPITKSNKGNRYILVAVEALTSYPLAWPTKDLTSETVAEHLLDLIEVFGIPKSLKTDGGSCFKAKNFAKICSKHGIIHKVNIAYQPEWLGKVERMNQTIRYSLARSCDGNYTEWERALSCTMRGIRSRKLSKGYSPYELMFGVKPKMNFEYTFHAPISLQARVLESLELKNIRRRLMRNSESSNQRPSFNIGDMVLVLHYSLRKHQMRDKMSPRYIGPYVIQNILPHNTYKVRSEKGNIHYYHASRLIRYFRRDMGALISYGRVE